MLLLLLLPVATGSVDFFLLVLDLLLGPAGFTGATAASPLVGITEEGGGVGSLVPLGVVSLVTLAPSVVWRFLCCGGAVIAAIRGSDGSAVDKAAAGMKCSSVGSVTVAPSGKGTASLLLLLLLAASAGHKLRGLAVAAELLIGWIPPLEASVNNAGFAQWERSSCEGSEGSTSMGW